MCHLIDDAIINQLPFVSPKRANDKSVRDWREDGALYKATVTLEGVSGLCWFKEV